MSSTTIDGSSGIADYQNISSSTATTTAELGPFKIASPGAYFALLFLVLAATSAFTVWFYARRGTPRAVLVTGATAMFFAFSTVILVPIDLLEDPRLTPALTDLWRVVYWFMFILNWIIVPIVQDYHNAGEFTFKGKLGFAIRANAKLYGAAGILGLMIAIPLIAKNGGLSISDLLGIALAMAQTAGFVVVIILLGHGMVELPRSLWRWVDDAAMLNYYYFKVARTDDQVRLAAGHWVQALETVRKIGQAVKESPDLIDNFNVIKAGCPRPEDLEENPTPAGSLPKRLQEAEKKPYTQKNLVILNQHCKLLTRRYTQVVGLRTGFIHEATKLLARQERIEAAAATPDRRARVAFLRTFKIGVAIVFTIISLILEWCEVTIPSSEPLCPLSYMRNPPGFQVFSAMLFFSLLWVMTCQLLFFLNIPRYYHVSPDHHTDENSLLYMCGNLLNVAAPLTYNFMALSEASGDSAFFTVIGKMRLVPFIGTGVHTGLPVFIVLISLLTLPHLVEKFLQCVLGTLNITVADRDNDDISLVDYDITNDRGDQVVGRSIVKAHRDKADAAAAEAAAIRQDEEQAQA